MKKLIIIICFMVAKTMVVEAQQYPLFTNYITNCFGFNPAVAGLNDWTDVRFMYRTQWVQVNEAPKTMLANFNTKIKNKPFGVGAYFYNDTYGKIKRTGASAAFSFTQQLNADMKLCLGASAGYYNFKLASGYRAYDTNADPTLSNAEAGKWVPDFNVGLYLAYKQAYVGFSIPQIMEQKLNFTDVNNELSSALKRHYYTFAGYKFPINEKMYVEPSALVKLLPNTPVQYDASLKLGLTPAFWIGGSYRSTDAIAAMVGFNMGKMNLAYAYDVTTSKLNATSAGSHEITLGFRIGGDPDRDKDGIPDKDDKCPDCPGVKENEGCPKDDRDKDCILDKDDKCPDCPGVKENEGCPKDDRDKDCIPDAEDECPDEPGTKEMKGCPDKNKDTDGDGVPDVDDQCPKVAGLKENKGCPFADRDNDGIRDDVDKCPDVAGTLQNLGCPLGDRDQDGVMDNVDPCPDEAGPISNQGCPPGKGPGANNTNGDRDGDGVLDSADKCPNTSGPVENGGCPIIPKEGQTVIDLAIRNVYFDYRKAEIRRESFKYLDNLANWMVNHPEYRLYLGGHTDSRGTEDYNMNLSKNRVYAVMYYLADRGVAPERVQVEYFGEGKPSADNITENGRQENRKVEMKWQFE